MTNLSSYKQYYYPADATAEAWHIQNGKTAYLSAGKVTGSGYFPAMMQFDGSTGYLQRTSTWNLSAGFTICAVLKVDSFVTATRSNAYLLDMKSGASVIALGLVVEASDNAEVTRQSKLTMFSQTTGPTNICHVTSGLDIANGERRIVLGSYDPVGGIAHLYIDDIETLNASAQGYSLTTGTPGGSSGLKTIGKNSSVSGRDYPGQLGFFGIGPYIDLSVEANRAKFYRSDLSLIKQDESVWANSGWGVQPLIWNEHGFPTVNAGSGGAFAVKGTISVAAL